MQHKPSDAEAQEGLRTADNAAADRTIEVKIFTFNSPEAAGRRPVEPGRMKLGAQPGAAKAQTRLVAYCC